MQRFSCLAAIVSILLVTALGCESRITGNMGNLEFSYPAADSPGNFNKPIAVGAKLELKVAEAGSRRQVELQSAETDDPDILSVLSFSGDSFILEGMGSGNALVSVTATVPSGETLPDAVNMMARVPDVLTISHTCASGPEAHYLVNHDVKVGFAMAFQQQSVIGYGYHPVDFDPPDALDLDVTSRDQRFMNLRTGEEPGVVVMTSQIDDTTASMILVEKADVDGARLGPTGQGPAVVGTSRFYHLLPTIEESPICQAVMAFTVESETPEICSAFVVGEPVAPALANEEGWVRIDPLEVGTCTFTVAFTDIADVEARIDVEVIDP